MRNPVDVLKSLEDKSCNQTYRYERLYRNLYNAEFYLLAYKSIATSQGSMTAGADGHTLDDMSILDRVLHHCTVINIKGESYRLKERKEYMKQKQQIVNTLFEQNAQ